MSKIVAKVNTNSVSGAGKSTSSNKPKTTNPASSFTPKKKKQDINAEATWDNLDNLRQTKKNLIGQQKVAKYTDPSAGLDVKAPSDSQIKAIDRQIARAEQKQRDGYSQKYAGKNRTTIDAAMRKLKGDKSKAAQHEYQWLQENQYNYWTTDQLKSGIKAAESQSAKAKKTRDTAGDYDVSTMTEKEFKAYQKKAKAGELISKNSKATESMRRALEAREYGQALGKLSEKQQEELLAYGRANRQAGDSKIAAALSSFGTGGMNFANTAEANAREKEQNAQAKKVHAMLKSHGFSEDKISALMDYSTRVYNEQLAKDIAESVRNESGIGKAAASIVSVPANIAGGVVGAVDLIGQRVTAKTDPLTGQKKSIDFNSRGQMLGNTASTIRQTVSEDMTAAGSFLYNTGMSIADFLVAGSAGSAVAETLLGSSAAQNAAQEAHRRGASDDQALLVGLASGVAEALFEHLSLEKLDMFKVKSSGVRLTAREVADAMVKQGFTEGSEEVATTLANTLTDAIIMGDKSDLNTSIRAYMGQGLSREDATRQAWKDWAVQLSLDGLGGALSGGVTSGTVAAGSVIGNTLNDLHTGQDIVRGQGITADFRLEEVQEGLNLPKGSRANKQATAILKKMAAGQRPSALDIGRMNNLLREDMALGLQPRANREGVGVTILHRNEQNGEVNAEFVTGPLTDAFQEQGLKVHEAMLRADVLQDMLNGEDVKNRRLKDKLQIFSDETKAVLEKMTGKAVPDGLSAAETIEFYKTTVRDFIEQRDADIAALEEEGEAVQQQRREYEEAAAKIEETAQQQAEETMNAAIEEAEANQTEEQTGEQETEGEQQNAPQARPAMSREEFEERYRQQFLAEHGEEADDDQIEDAWNRRLERDGILLDDGRTIGKSRFFKEIAEWYATLPESDEIDDEHLVSGPTKLTEKQLMRKFLERRALSRVQPEDSRGWPDENAPAEEATEEETAQSEEAQAEEQTEQEEAQPEETPTEEAPVEEAPVEEAPAEETPAEEAPVEEAPVEEAPVEEAPVEEAPVEEAEKKAKKKTVIPTKAEAEAAKAETAQAEEAKTEEKPAIPSKAQTEEAKEKLKAAITVPVQTKNTDAIERGIKSGELTKEMLTYTGGNMRNGFSTYQRATIAEALVDGSKTDSNTISISVPGDGKLTIQNTPSAIAQTLDRLGVKVNQRAAVDSALAGALKKDIKDRNVTVVKARSGGNYAITNGNRTLISVSPVAAEGLTAKTELDSKGQNVGGFGGRTINSSEGVEDVLGATYGRITEAPTSYKEGSTTYYVYNVDGVDVAVRKSDMAYLDGGALYGAQISGRMYAIKSVNPDGTVRGYTLADAKPNIPGERALPNTKSFTNAALKRFANMSEQSGPEKFSTGAKPNLPRQTGRFGGLTVKSGKKVTYAMQATAELMQDLFKPYGIEHVVFDGDNLGPGKNASVRGNTIRINENLMHSAGLMYWAVGHELTHPSAESDPNLTNEIIKTLTDLYKAGALEGELASEIMDQIANPDAAVAERKETYTALYTDDGLTPAEVEAETTDDKMREELAADWMGYVLFSQPVLERIAGTKPTFLTRVLRAVDRIKGTEVNSLLKSGKTYRESMKALNDLADRMHTALAKRKAEDGMNDDSDVKYSAHKGPAWKNVQYGFKLMTVGEDNLPHALFIDSGEPFQLGVAYDADAPGLEEMLKHEPGFAYLVDRDGTVDESSKRPIKRNGSSFSGLPNPDAVNAATDAGKRWMTVTRDAKGKLTVHNVGINGGKKPTSSAYALRPGIHAVDIPSMRHIGPEYKDDSGDTQKMRKPNQRWFLIEYPVDEDYNQEAYNNPGREIKDHLPTNGWYSFQTNSGAEARQHWFITGGMRIVGAVSEEDARKYARDRGFEEDLEWRDGKTYDDSDAIDLDEYIRTTTAQPTPSKEEMRRRIEAAQDMGSVDESGNVRYSATEPHLNTPEVATPETEGEAASSNGINEVSGFKVYNHRAIVSEDTLGRWLNDYAASNPNYAQAYMTYMSPSDYLNLTTGNPLSRNRITQEAEGLGVTGVVDASKQQPIQLRIDSKTGEVLGHEGRHRMVALRRAGVTRVPVMLFDSSNKYNKTPLDTLTLHGQFNRTADATVADVQPFSRGNEEAIREKFVNQTSMERIGEKYGNPQVRFSAVGPVPGLYNLSERVLRDVKQDKLGAASVVNMLRGKGVKAEEIKWLGIEDFLKGKKSVTKQELLDYIAANDLQIEEETLENGPSSFMDLDTGELYESFEEAYAEAERRAESEGYSPDNVFIDSDDDEQWILGAYSPELGETTLVSAAPPAYYGGGREEETRWAEYTTPGGSNYREILFRLPGSKYTNRASEAHWGDSAPGVFAHARVQDFDTATDGRVLFVEEIQSDWHNEGQQYGYGGKESELMPQIEAGEQEYRKVREKWEQDIHAARMVRRNARESMGRMASMFDFPGSSIESYLDRFGLQHMKAEAERLLELDKDKPLTKNELTAADIFAEAHAKVRELERIRPFQDMYLPESTTPDAPFAKNYTDFVLKRLLREAAEKGYDGVAWTSADMQSARWSDEYAEGYRIEYDQDIPKFLNKFGKKFGARVDETELLTDDGRLTVPFLPVTDSMRESVMTEGMPKFSAVAPKLPPRITAAYDQAVRTNNSEEAQRLVDEVAAIRGYPKAGFHGTVNGGFTQFDKYYSHIGGNSGAGFYFSSNVDDATGNYSDIEGADNYFKASTFAEQIMDAGEWDGEPVTDWDEALRIAKEEMTTNPMVYNVYLDLGDTYTRDFRNSTNIYDRIMDDFDESLYDREDYDSDDDYEEALYMARDEHLFDAIDRAVVGAFSDIEQNYELMSNVDLNSLVSDLTTRAAEYGDLTWDDILRVVGDRYIDLLTPDESEVTDGSHEITRAIIENFGYNSITDKEVPMKFNQVAKLGKGAKTTEHYIVFQPGQIKSADPFTYDDDGKVIPIEERFNPANKNIRYSAYGSNPFFDNYMKKMQEENRARYLGDNPPVQRQSQTRSTDGLLTDEEKETTKRTPGSITHTEVKDEAMQQMVGYRLDTDEDVVKEKRRLFRKDKKWDAADTATAEEIIKRETEKARETGDYSEVRRLLRVHDAQMSDWGLAGHTAREFGESFAGIVADATDTVDQAVEHEPGNQGKRKQADRVAKGTSEAGKDALGKVRDELNAAAGRGKGNRPGTVFPDKRTYDKQKQTGGTSIVDSNMVNEPFTFEYADAVGTAVAKGVDAKLKQSEQSKTFLQQLQSEIMRFASETLPVKKRRKAPTTATELLKSYVENRDFFEQSWTAARDELRRKYGDELPAGVQRFMRGWYGLSDNALNSKIMRAALVSSAMSSEETVDMIRKQAAVGAKDIGSVIAKDLIAKTGAKGELANMINVAADFYVDEVLDREVTVKGQKVAYDAAQKQKTADRLIQNALRDIGKAIDKDTGPTSMKKLGATSAASKAVVHDAVVNTLINKYAVSEADAERVADVVGKRFDALLREGMEQRLESIFKEKKKPDKTKQQSFLDRVIELTNLGAMDSDAYRDAAVTKLLDDYKTRRGVSATEVLNKVYDYADRLDRIPEGDVAGLKDIISKLNAERWTGGMIKGNEIHRTLRKAIDTIGAEPGGERFLRQLAAAQIRGIANDNSMLTVTETLGSVRYLAMLSKLTTTMRNLVGNTTFDITETLSNNFATPLDMLLSKVTGRRTTDWDLSYASSAKRRGMAEAARRAYIEVALDAPIEDGQNRWEMKDGRTFKMAKPETTTALNAVPNIAERLLSSMEKWQRYLLTVSDEFYKGGIRDERQRGIDRLKARGLLEEDALQNEAQQVALERTFQNRDKMATALDYARTGLDTLVGVKDYKGNRIGLGTALMPFARVPANIVGQVFNYSPAGLAKAIGEVAYVVKAGKRATAEEQAKAVRDFGRGINGTALIGLFALAAIKGALKHAGSGDDDKDALLRDMGQTGTQLNLDSLQRIVKNQDPTWKKDDTLVSIGGIEPLNGPMAFGALLADSLDENGPIWAKILNANFQTGMASLADLPAMSSINNIVNAYKNSDEKYDEETNPDGGPWKQGLDAAATGVGDFASSFVPNILGGIAAGMDEGKTRTPQTSEKRGLEAIPEETLNSLKLKIPGLRSQLPQALDSFGKPRQTTATKTQNWLNSNVLPLAVNSFQPNPVSQELISLKDSGAQVALPKRNAIKTVDTATGQKKLTETERRKYQEKAGGLMYDNMLSAMDNSTYKSSDDELRAKVWSNLKSYAGYEGKKAVGGKVKKDEKGNEVLPSNIAWSKKYDGSTSDKAIAAACFTAAKQKAGIEDTPTIPEVISAVNATNLSSSMKDMLITKNISEAGAEKYNGAKAVKLSASKYVELLDATSQEKMPADKKDNGDSISGSRKKKVVAYLDAQVQNGYLTPEQRDFIIHDVYGWK